MFLELHKQKKLFQVVKFGVVGALCAALDMFLFILLFEYLHLNYLVANFSSTCLAILLNYFISKKWVFRSGKYSNKVELAVFVSFSLVGLLLNQGLIWLFVEHSLLDPKLGKLLAIVLVAIFNFITKKAFVFKG
ncbi:GtrA family protein [Pontibacter qinzhouensis]|uniref:GtrA family protein n=1 Tax=Pontibacter qinzhouensis TaxID=2603253 RepID=UPI00164EDBF3|nr:GtrA family protein [Pontibacter qinzhouensis]